MARFDATRRSQNPRCSNDSMPSSFRYSCRNTSCARSSAASRRLSMRNPMLNTEPWCARTRAAKASASPARACVSSESGMEGAGFILFHGTLADLGNAEFSFELREPVDVDAADDADHGEFARLGGDDGQTAGLAAVLHAYVDVDIFLGIPLVNLHQRIPLRALELLARGFDIGLGITRVAVELVAAHLHRLDVVEDAQRRIVPGLVLGDHARQRQQETAHVDVHGFRGLGAQV